MAGRFVLDELPPIRAKGKRQPVAIFALTGERSAGSATDVARLCAAHDRAPGRVDTGTSWRRRQRARTGHWHRR